MDGFDTNGRSDRPRDDLTPSDKLEEKHSHDFTWGVRMQIENDDPNLTKLTIGPNAYLPRAEDWENDGKSIERNTHIKEVEFWGLEKELGHEYLLPKHLFSVHGDGPSIQKMIFRECNLLGGELFRASLIHFLRKNNNGSLRGPGAPPLLITPRSSFSFFSSCSSLESFSSSDDELYSSSVDYLEMTDCDLAPQGKMLLGFLRELTMILINLNSVKVFKISRSDDASSEGSPEKAIRSLEGLSAWNKIILWNSHSIGRSDSALTFLLSNRNDLVLLDVYENCIDDEHAAFLSIALAWKNRPPTITINRMDWGRLSAVLRRPTSLAKLSRTGNPVNGGCVTSRLKTLTLGGVGRTSPNWENLFDDLQSPACVTENLDLSGNSFNDDTAILLFNALANNRSLKSLNLSSSLRQVGNRTWTALSDCLQSPESVLEQLNLCYSPIGQHALHSFACALANNKKLTELLMFTDPDWFTRWEAFSRLLCRTTTITDTFNSNHTLERVVNRKIQPKSIKGPLEMNQRTHKFGVARQKIIDVHFSGGIDVPYFEVVELGVLPHAIAWVSGGKIGHWSGGGVSFFYQFVRNMSSFFDFIGSGMKSESCQDLKHQKTETVGDIHQGLCIEQGSKEECSDYAQKDCGFVDRGVTVTFRSSNKEEGTNFEGSKIIRNNRGVCVKDCWKDSILGSTHLSLRSQGTSDPVWQDLFDYLQSPSCALESLDLSGKSLNDDVAIPLFNALANNCSVEILNLSGSFRQVSNATWMALSDCLRNPKPVLKKLNLCYSSINNDALLSFACALADNTKLTELLMYNDPNWNKRWDMFSRLLCGTSSIMETFKSNHTLQRVVSGKGQPQALKGHLEINQEKNKFDVARQKIINIHFRDDIDMQHFIDMELGVLPRAIAWVSGGGASFLYQFVKNMPLFFDFTGSGMISERCRDLKRQRTEVVRDNREGGCVEHGANNGCNKHVREKGTSVEQGVAAP